jgi:hypothetical protein
MPSQGEGWGGHPSLAYARFNSRIFFSPSSNALGERCAFAAACSGVRVHGEAGKRHLGATRLCLELHQRRSAAGFIPPDAQPPMPYHVPNHVLYERRKAFWRP